MATATAPKIENPRNSADLSSMSQASHNASSALPPTPPGVGGDEWKGKAGTLAAKGKDVDDGDAVTDIQKKMKRAARFGLPVHLSEEEKRNTRAERFGTVSAEGLHSSKQSEELKKRARAERFGIVQSAPTDEEAKKKARLSRFGMSPVNDPSEEAKKKARALRFSQQDSGLKGNGKGDVVKTVSGDKAGEGT